MGLDNNVRLRSMVVAGLAAAQLLVPLAAPAAPKGGLQDSKRRVPTATDVRTMARRAIAAVGLILVSDGKDARPRRPRGSGVVVRKDGLIVTNYHVIAKSSSTPDAGPYEEIFFRLNPEAGPHRLKLLTLDKTHDLALLRIEPGNMRAPGGSSSGFPAVEIAGQKDIKLLDELVIIGFPETGGPTVTVNVGVVEGVDPIGNWIKTDARLIHGNSGGAAVNREGRLVGIPTKVIVDGDGSRQLGAVGFLRPAHLIPALIARSEGHVVDNAGPAGLHQENPPPVDPSRRPDGVGVTIRGIVRSAADGKPVAGARIGLVPLGAQNVTEANLVSWGGSDPDGLFVLNKTVAPGRYTLRARAIGYELCSMNVDIGPNLAPLTVQLKSAQ